MLLRTYVLAVLLLSFYEMDTETRVQIPVATGSCLQNANTLDKGTHPTILPSE